MYQPLLYDNNRKYYQKIALNNHQEEFYVEIGIILVATFLENYYK